MFPSDDEWTELLARTAVRGSAAVQAKFADYREIEEDFYRETGYLEMLKERETEQKTISEWQQSVEASRRIALEAIDDAEKAIRDELATL